MKIKDADPTDFHHALEWRDRQKSRMEGLRSRLLLWEVISTIDEGRLGEHLHAALHIRRERHAAGALQRGLADHAGVRHSSTRSDRLQAVVSTARLRRAL